MMTDKTNPDQTGLTALQQYLTDNRKIIPVWQPFRKVAVTTRK